MKALSLLQPWADVVISGVKKIENRSRQVGFKAPYPQFDANLPLFRALLPRPQFVQIVDDASPTTSSPGAARVGEDFPVTVAFAALHERRDE